MNFDFSDEEKRVQRAARELLEKSSPLSHVRQILDARAAYDTELWSVLAEMGWMGVAVASEHGGIDSGYLELALIAEELGRSLAAVPFSSSVYLAAEALKLAGSAEQRALLLPGVVSGKRIGALAAFERLGQIGFEDTRTKLENGRIHGTKIPVVDGPVADFAIVLATMGRAGPTLALVDLTGGDVRSEALQSFDPLRPLGRLVFDGAKAEPLGEPGRGLEILAALFDRAAVLIAFEQLGGAQRCLETARDYTLGRYAFGRPVASFQAIKHKLADMYAAIELARSNCYFGVWALSSGSAELPLAACLARVSATEAFEMCARESLQAHGGVGFTWEFDCHLFVRRSALLSLMLGPVGIWKDRLVGHLERQASA